MVMYDNDNIFQKSFDNNYISEPLLQAQWAEFVMLKEIITQMYAQKNEPISILDIGIGSGRIAKHLSGIDEIWNMIAVFDGTDNAQACVNLTNETANELKIDNKVKAYFFDAQQLNTWSKTYDLIIITWFTAGNFYPDNFSFDTYNSGNDILDLSQNPKFETIFSAAYQLLNPNGKIVIGACYIDNDATRIKQEQAYKKMGMSLITNNKDSFTATKEGFWSQRFTKEKLLNYLWFVDSKKISFEPLDTYNFAMQVCIQK